ncbi:hypothetical protein QAD02_013700 [Eretmocerus hayati]|uniref:Uncharacterized protein n=1 Tax=Eretmocerus hayati TaxID=131215 RepID=A0ACC2P483_9HYME|nr:hypothetical protein QAD02_013700 [Eretmocerus hayati]
MDMNVRLWNNVTNEAETRYLKSCFLECTRACDIQESFEEATSDLEFEEECLPVEMDDPHVNWKLFNELLSKNPNLLETASCGLHVERGAYKDAANATEWEVIQYGKYLHYLSENYPARRSIYTEYSGSEVFPKKCCSIRWLENIPVIDRAIEIDTSVKKYVRGIMTAKTEPKCESCTVVRKFCTDPLLLPKLVYFKFLASDVEPFLREFQSDDPKVLFLHTVLA